MLHACHLVIIPSFTTSRFRILTLIVATSHLDCRCASDPVAALGRLGQTSSEDAPDIFGFEIDVKLDEVGQLYVLDRRNQTVKVFDDQGQLVGGFGRAGPGPGEFLDPMAIELLANDRIVVVDRGNRINSYTPAAEDYHYLDTHILDVVPERACSAAQRLFVSGWRRADNTMIHEVPIGTGHAIRHFGAGYRAKHWIVQDQLSDGPIGCLDDPARVVLAFEMLPVLHAYSADDGTLLWEARIEDFLQPPVLEQRSTGSPRVFFSSRGVRDVTVSLTPVDQGHLLLQTLRFEPSDDPDIQTRSYLVHAGTGQGAFVSAALPLIPSFGGDYYIATWMLPFPRLEVRRWRASACVVMEPSYPS